MPQYEDGLCRLFTDSLGAYFSLPGGIVLATIPQEARKTVQDSFNRWVTYPITELFHGESGHPKLFPTGFMTSTKPLVMSPIGERVHSTIVDS